MNNKLDAMFDGTAGGFQPEPVEMNEAEAKAAFEAEPEAVEPEQPESEPVAEPAAKTIAESDAAALSAAGWSAEDIKGLSPEAAARHALREGNRQKQPERAEEPSGPSDLEAMLTEEFSGKTAKKLAPILKGIVERQAALERGARDREVEASRASLVGAYPELKRAEAMTAVLTVAGNDPKQLERAARLVFGERQSPSERQEAYAQVNGQMSGGRRGPVSKPSTEKAERAAWAHFTKTGNHAEALSVKSRLGG